MNVVKVLRYDIREVLTQEGLSGFENELSEDECATERICNYYNKILRNDRRNLETKLSKQVFKLGNIESNDEIQ